MKSLRILQMVSGRTTVHTGIWLRYLFSVLTPLMLISLVTVVSLDELPLSVCGAQAAQGDYKARQAVEVEDEDEASKGDESEVLPDQSIISAEEAMVAAEAGNPGSKALEAELENEDGALVYEVELDNGPEVMVDATTGALLASEQDDED